jgi:hypothetical protein
MVLIYVFTCDWSMLRKVESERRAGGKMNSVICVGGVVERAASTALVMAGWMVSGISRF